MQKENLDTAGKKFLVDIMLIKLGRWLRILGYDCKIPKDNEISDEDLLDIAEKENRTLITMDKSLSERKTKIGIIHIPSEFNSVKAQLEFLIKKKYIANPMTEGNIEEKVESSVRCSKCGSILFEITKEELNDSYKKKIEKNKREDIDRALSSYNLFWICKDCHQIYWKGSHWKKIIEFLSKLEVKDY
ncbi:MAG: Mut7-C RNAse domain-containing protein [Candidatus Micrarchaeia archaeon]